MAPNRVKSYALVAIQFGILIVLAFTGPILATHPLYLVMELAAVALGVWALLTVRLDKVNVLPDLRTDSTLVQHGPYRWIRHPMYAAILLGALALVLNAPSLLRWILYVVLVVDLVVKLQYEEGMLATHFPGYGDYMGRTKRIIPFVF